MTTGKALQIIFNPKFAKDPEEFSQACHIYRTKLAYVLCPSCNHNLIRVEAKRRGKVCFSCWVPRDDYVKDTLAKME